MEDLRWPREVWAAVEGDRAPLLELLRGDREMGRPTRNALADWLDGSRVVAGKLKPVKLPRHRVGTESKIGWAWYRYDRAREFIRKKGWNRKGAARCWPPQRLLEAVAQKEGVSPDALNTWVRRQKPWALATEAELSAHMLEQSRTAKQREREEIARKIRSKK